MTEKLKTPVQISSTPLVGSPSTPFNQLDTYDKPFFEDDYVHKTPLSLKYKGVSTNFLVNAKGKFNIALDNKEPLKNSQIKASFTQGDAKLITRLSDKVVLETKCDNNGIIRLWSAFGQYDVGIQSPLSFWGKLKTNTVFEKWSGFVHTCLNGDGFTYNTRIARKTNEILYLNENLNVRYRDFNFSVAGKINLGNFAFTKYNALLAYKAPNYDMILQHTSLSKTGRMKIGELSFSTYLRSAKYTSGLKIGFRPNEKLLANKFNAMIGGIFTINKDLKIKTKINHKAELALSLKCRLNSHVLATFGTMVACSCLEAKKSGKKKLIPVGAQFTFSY